MGVLLKMLNLKLVLVLVTVIGQIHCRPKLSPESKRKLAEFRTMLEASEGNTGASDNAADAAAPQIRSSGASADPSIDAADLANDAGDPAADAADPSADSPRKIDEETIDAVDMAGDAAEVAMADGDKMADPMADAADMADPMADAADAETDTADTAAYIKAADAAADEEEVIAGDEEVIAADAAVADPPVHDPLDVPQIPESGYDGKNGMLGKLMVSIMEKLGNGEPIKMIVDVKNPAVMMSESNNRHSQPGEAGLRTLGNPDKKEKEIVDRNGKT